MLSPQRAARITGAIAKTLGPYTQKQDLLLRNLAFGLPECDNPQDMARRVWENLGMVVGEFPHGKAFFNPETADSYLEIVGEEHFRYVRRWRRVMAPRFVGFIDRPTIHF